VREKEVALYQYKLDELQHDEKGSSEETRELTHRVAELEAEIAQANLEISRTRIKAPFSGYLTLRTVNVGQRVRAMDPLFNLGSFSPLYADVFLSERESHQVRRGQLTMIRLGMEGTDVAAGFVLRTSPVVDQATGTVKVTIEVKSARASFRPGAFVRVDIKTDTHVQAVLIPKRAVIEEDGQNFVYTAHGDTARRARVNLGFQYEGQVEIQQGLAPGQKIVVAGQGALKEGSKIKVIKS